ncbi:MAG: PepSY-associated TM helix domain-containing protein [Phaeodactylibacter sp.]|uniref:PepSY-associated TM helix domain-containing protein n=1 Tax=Phaeodactylibacter sp. TaxID=1940289 RepID=UPI0032F045DE
MDTKQQASLLRKFRALHRYTGALLFFFFFWIGISGLSLGWKKHSGGAILPDTQRGAARELSQWLPVDRLGYLAVAALKAEHPGLATTIDRMDVRPGKGVVKVRFEGHHTEVQVDGATGEVLQIATRHSDWLEALHDGSIVENWLGLSGGYFKLFYTSVMGLALLLFTVTGFWLWYGPRRLRAAKRNRR